MIRSAGFWIAHIYVSVISFVLIGAFLVQFGQGELPCPLCILQRMAMMLCACGPAYIILMARQGELTRTDFASGYGMSIVAAVSGACISIRHILLHIVPPDPGYGSPMFGLHLYTWALIVFAAVLVVSGLNLIFIHELQPRKVSYRWPSKVVIGLFGTVIVANVVGVFFEEGFHWTLPDNPVRYQLLYDLGLLNEAQDSL